jgi:protein-disulfide isomerase
MVKRAEVRARRERAKRTQKLISIGTVVAGLILIGVVALLIITGQSNATSVIDDIIMPEKHDRLMVSENSMGDPNAPVKVNEFSNYECSHCKTFAEGLEGYIASTYIETGKVYLTFVPFTWTETAAKAAEAAYCAMDQGQYWEYHDVLFANQTNTSLPGFTNAVLFAIAEKLELDSSTFEKCLTSGKYTNQVTKDSLIAQEQGATGTPTFDVNGELVFTDGLEDAIKTALGQ